MVDVVTNRMFDVFNKFAPHEAHPNDSLSTITSLKRFSNDQKIRRHLSREAETKVTTTTYQLTCGNLFLFYQLRGGFPYNRDFPYNKFLDPIEQISILIIKRAQSYEPNSNLFFICIDIHCVTLANEQNEKKNV